MPYIKPERRSELDPAINQLVHALRCLTATKGDVNYCVTRIALGALLPDTLLWSYTTLSDTIAALQDSADEIKRRLLGLYEDTCIRRNGDVFEFGDKIQ